MGAGRFSQRRRHGWRGTPAKPIPPRPARRGSSSA